MRLAGSLKGAVRVGKTARVAPFRAAANRPCAQSRGSSPPSDLSLPAAADKVYGVRPEVAIPRRWVGGFTAWLAGGGMRGGKTIGATDEVGMRAVEDRFHIDDLHATILKLLGLDRTKPTFLFQGRQQRLTDVGGENEFAEKLVS